MVGGSTVSLHRQGAVAPLHATCPACPQQCHVQRQVAATDLLTDTADLVPC